ncbi:hypothetical protein FXN61_41625 [Lentzea sp. PSKA42]|uniref:Uncharacterized protein n=1 Tax=Lentzea indica TaxID=2604800 RepID=A0ABX1FVD1_9PSEU|nr:hypothetical protein [Lentzea indica]NKE62880.1 hypothetical protein [Lentzea indica]
MSDSTHPGDTSEKSGSTRNTQRGTADQVIQAGDVHGDLNVGTSTLRAWLLPAGIVITAVFVGAAIVAVPGMGKNTTGDIGGQAPSELRVTADLSSNDMGPWGYVSESPDFPGADLVKRLSRPMAAADRAIARDVRLSGAASLRQQVIRLHLEGPKDRAITVTDIRPVIRDTRPPLNGSLVWAPPQGPELSSEVLLKLDDPFPVVQSSVEDATGRRRVPAGPFFPAHTIKLNDGETHEVVVTASADVHSYDYELAVIYQSGANVKEVRVNDSGRDFRISGMACGGPHIASYRAAYVLTGDFSVVPEPNPGHISVLSDC